MNKPLRRVISATLALSLSVTLAVNAYAEATANSYSQEAASAGYARKGQYVLFATGENAMQLNTTKTTVNGNLYAGGDLNAYSGEVDVNGKTVIGGKLYKHDYTVWDSYIFEENADKQSLDNEALDNAFTALLGEDYLTHEYWYTYSGSEVTGDASIYAKSGLQYCADSVNISGTLISDSYMMISASKAFTTEGEINMYVKNGNVGIYAGEVDIDGVLYAPNGTVQICATDVDISGMIIAKEIQISAQNVTISENFTLSAAQCVKCYEDQIFAINAEYNAESKNIDVALASTYPGGNYSIYTSYDGEDYLLNGTTTETSYSFAADETADAIYIKAVQTYDNGVSLNSNIVKMVADEELGFVQEYVDTDSDGLIDMYEHIFGSDIENPDTDSDGLSDFVEVMMSATDPLYIDSDEDEITDGNEDCDEDKLTNLQEIAYNTSIVSEDTDSDGLTDYDEIFVYGTKPENPDTDDDTINDGDEVSLGLDPLSADSDGDGTDDCKEKIRQTYVHDVENEDCAVDEVIVDIEATGNIQATMSVESVMGIDVLCSNVAGLVGEPFEINTTSEFDEATITFKVDTEKLDTEIDNLVIVWYDEDNRDFVIMDTVYDFENNTLSTVTNHFSLYFISFRKEMMEYNKGTAIEEYYPDIQLADVIFIATGMQVEDGTAENGLQGQLISDYLALSEADTNPAIAYNATEIMVHNGISYETIVSFGSYKTEVDNALQNIDETKVSYDGYAALAAAVGKFSSVAYTREHKKAIVVFTYGGNEYASDDWIEAAIEHNITVCVVALGDSYLLSLKEITEKTGGIFVTASDSNAMSKIYDRLTSYDLYDSDIDGLPDVFETAGMKLPTGEIIRTNIDKPDSDDDGLLDGEEIAYTINDGYVKFKLVSNPTLADSDGDGYDDKKEFSIYNSNPLVNEVVIHKLKNDYIAIDYTGAEEWKNNDKTTVSYGGYQGWFFNDGNAQWYSWIEDGYIIQKYGCGLISSSDILLYLALSDIKYSTIETELVDFNLSGNINYDTYCKYINCMRGMWFQVARWIGVNGIAIANGINGYSWRRGLGLKARWNTSENDVLQKIIKMLDNNYPVTLSIGPVGNEAGIWFYDLIPRDIDKYNFEVDSYPYIVRGHYVTVTGVIINGVKNQTMLEISSWGDKYYVDFAEYSKYIDVFSNIVYLE